MLTQKIGYNYEIEIFRYIIVAIFTACTICSDKLQSVKSPLERDGLVAYWDFSSKGRDALEAKGSAERFRLSPVGNVAFAKEGTISGESIFLDGKSYLTIPYAKTGALNVKSGQVSVLAWIKKSKNSDIGFIGGMWNEFEDGGKRQYGLFVSLPYYNGKDQVCGHISKRGGATPTFPYSIDYSASAQKVPFEEWTFVAFTYDGKYIRSFVNGVFEKRAPELIDHTKGFVGYPNGLVQSKNPYFYPDGIGDNGSDFTVGSVRLKRGMGNFYKGHIGALAVYNRALSEAEMREIHKAVSGAK